MSTFTTALGKIRAFFRLADAAEAEQRQRARIFFLTWMVAVCGLSIFIIFYSIFARSYNILPMVALELFAILSFILYKRGFPDLAVNILIWAFLMGLLSLAVFNDGLLDTALHAFPALMIIAALLLVVRQLIFFSVFSFLTLLAFGILQVNHVLVYPVQIAIDYSDVFDLLVIFAATITVVVLIASFLRKSRAEVKDGVGLLSQSEVRYRDLFDSVNLAIFQTTIEGRILAVNPEFARMFAFLSPEEVAATVGDTSELFVEPAQRDEMMRLIAERPDMTVFETPYRRRDGTTFLGRLNVRQIVEPKSGVSIFQGFIEDITEHRQAEERIRQSLEEKEILLRELFHRTKNNMTVIIAMLKMQAQSVDDPHLKAALGDTQNRIRSMALVHERLFVAQDLSYVDLSGYISDLGSLLLDSHNISSARVAIVPTLESVPVLIESAISCGLILNELITNSLKHAFPDGRAGEIRICLSRAEDGTIRLEVADNGVGVPPDFDFRRSGRTGAQNVFLFVEHQLCGQVSVDTGPPGVAWRIEFRDDQYQARV